MLFINVMAKPIGGSLLFGYLYLLQNKNIYKRSADFLFIIGGYMSPETIDDVLFVSVDVGATKVVAAEARMHPQGDIVITEIVQDSITDRLTYEFGRFDKPEVWRHDSAKVPLREQLQGSLVYQRMLESIHRVIIRAHEHRKFSTIVIGYCAPGIPTGISREQFAKGLNPDEIPFEHPYIQNGWSWAHNFPTVRHIRENLERDIVRSNDIKIMVSNKQSDAYALGLGHLHSIKGAFYGDVKNALLINAGTGIALADLIAPEGKKQVVDYDLQVHKAHGHQKGWEIRMPVDVLTQTLADDPGIIEKVFEDDQKTDAGIKKDGTISVEFVLSMAHLERRYKAATGESAQADRIYESAWIPKQTVARALVTDAMTALAHIVFNKAKTYQHAYTTVMEKVALTSYLGERWANCRFDSVLHDPFTQEFHRLMGSEPKLADLYLSKAGKLLNPGLIQGHSF